MNKKTLENKTFITKVFLETCPQLRRGNAAATNQLSDWAVVTNPSMSDPSLNGAGGTTVWFRI